MVRFSANLGFLWRDRPLVDAIYAAHQAGFTAVECHWPYDDDPALIRAALAETGLAMVALNTRVGGAGEFGLAAIPGREGAAREAIDEALDYAAAIGAGHVHLMAGCADDADAADGADGAAALDCFIENCRYACAAAGKGGRAITMLIEPINHHDVPGYFLHDFDMAERILDQVAAPNFKIMFDCYHAGRMGHDVVPLLDKLYNHIGHIQIASVPDRGTPDHGAVNYEAVFAAVSKRGYAGAIGAEYRPANDDTDASLGWLHRATAPHRQEQA